MAPHRSEFLIRESGKLDEYCLAHAHLTRAALGYSQLAYVARAGRCYHEQFLTNSYGLIFLYNACKIDFPSYRCR